MLTPGFSYKDATTMQSAENRVLGETPRGGPAAVMHSAARVNVRPGLVDPDQANDVVMFRGTSVSETNSGTKRIITETVADQVVQYIEPKVTTTTPGRALDRDAITIGEALEATAFVGRDKPIDHSDAETIQVAEVRANGTNEVRAISSNGTAPKLSLQLISNRG
ncbi:hypothetical protein K2173_018294 [Erythroxylum novogranatense]|uniref:SMP domain-containing protein n=1 Tax=Erythroxylum novogranatense TaxID=1862640 RepID=A0AAV8U9V8_9ROSI|nr:hypothetical protein K2173_018294 [Erythroxylum novogranatense]